MNWTLREEIAKERFLDMMANDKLSAENHLAAIAVAHADILIAALQYSPTLKQIDERMDKIKTNEPYWGPPKTKGCAKCYGSGGKKNEPCKVCKGSGRVVI